MNKIIKKLQVVGPEEPGYEAILTPEALAFLASLAAEFGDRIDDLLTARDSRQQELDKGIAPDFLTATRELRAADWRVADIPPDLQDRRVEITGPTDRKMIINALNSGASAFMADCEDSLAPTWDNIIRGQLNLRDAAAGTISHHANGKDYRLNGDPATLIVRPRGWHLSEKHMLLEGKRVPGALVDFGLYLFHNAAVLKAAGTGPYFYLPKLESHQEAALWADVFRFCEKVGVVEVGQIKVTVLIETLLAAFEIDEILYALRDYVVGMNCGRWDYIFSYIKKFRRSANCVLPDRVDVTMTSHFLRSYSQLVIKTCHKRGALAIGGMAAQIPIKDDAEANTAALLKVRLDKEREASDGHDGTWVAHPALVPLAREVFDELMPAANQVDKTLAELVITAADLLHSSRGRITERGVRDNISVAVQYMAAWLGGNGCVPINHLMEDAATAEISRAQLWQWVHHPTGVLDEGRNITYDFFKQLLREEMNAIRVAVGEDRFDTGHYRQAAGLLDSLTADTEFAEFLTSVAYEALD